MITVYFDGVKFSEKTFAAAKADVVEIGDREILNIKDRFDNTVGQFDMNCIVGWCVNSYDCTDEEGGTIDERETGEEESEKADQ